MSRRARARLPAATLAAGALAIPVAPAPAKPVAPAIEQLVVFPSGKVVQDRVRGAGATVKVGGRRCAVGAGTPLAALVRARPGRIGLRDFGSCSRHARDGGQLFVRSIGRDRNRGRNGWVYKVGHKQGTAGAADPAGPFGRGRLRAGQRVTWFYCLYRRGCQRTLALRATSLPGGIVSVRVRAYDDGGKGVAVAGARVSAAGVTAMTDPAGLAQLRLVAGSHTLRAVKAGLVASFGERVIVR